LETYEYNTLEFIVQRYIFKIRYRVGYLCKGNIHI